MFTPAGFVDSHLRFKLNIAAMLVLHIFLFTNSSIFLLFLALLEVEFGLAAFQMYGETLCSKSALLFIYSRPQIQQTSVLGFYLSYIQIIMKQSEIMKEQKRSGCFASFNFEQQQSQYNNMQDHLSVNISRQQQSKVEEQGQNYQSVLHKIEPPPTNFNFNQNALEYDIKLGWIPRSQISGPIPLSFSNYITDMVIQSKSKNFLYYGFRPRHSFELHEKYYQKGKKYPFYQFHLCKSQFLERFFKKYYNEYEFETSRQSSNSGQALLEFNSDFQGGNLDAVYFQEGEFRLLLRVDSNTQGHCNYYNFRVRANKSGKYSFRVMNINKQKSLYQRGMRPYLRWSKDGKWSEFRQCQCKVKFEDSPLCQQFQISTKLKSLLFEYQLSIEVDEYQFCYTIPYTYSNLLQFLNGLRNSPYFHFTKLCHTLSGVQIPLLTLAGQDELQQGHQTYVVVITGRVHPSEANSSYIVNGVIKSLLGSSQSAKYLRKNTIFKIIPMLNPDGVIIGNTRTSFAGKDMNRKYYKNAEFVFPEIIGVMDYVGKLKAKYGNKLLFVIDIHGHSARKNSFFYGPQFSIIDLQYTKCRMLPKIYAQKTDVFRYYSCKYKVASSKENTARGYFNTHGIRAYTHQTSMHSFWNFQIKKDEPFTKKTLQKLGQNLVQSIADYVRQHFTFAKYTKLETLQKQHPKLVQSISQQERPHAKKKGVDFQQDSSDSQELASSKDDSQDDMDDFEDNKLLNFYNRINENKEYFIEELQALEKDKSDRKEKDKNKIEEKKNKKTETQMKTETQFDQPQRSTQKRQKLQSELIVKKSGEKIDWASKVAYPQKKKFHQEYTKMSSVIFGSSIPPSYFKNMNEPALAQNSQLSTFSMTKYSIKCLQAQFKSNPVKYPSPEPKVYHVKQMKRQSSLRQQTSKELERYKQQQAHQLQRLKRQRFKQLKQQSQMEIEMVTNQRQKISLSEMDKILSRQSQFLKPLPVCSVDLKVQKEEQAKMIKNLSGSLKVLTRKKSIKSIRESEQSLTKRNSMKGVSLGNKLPSLHNILKF